MMVSPMATIYSAERDFGAQVCQEQRRLLVPENVAQALEHLSIRTAEEFVSYLYGFPSAVADVLGWPVADVLCAREELVKKLRSVVSDDILDPAPALPRPYGARPPGSHL